MSTDNGKGRTSAPPSGYGRRCSSSTIQIHRKTAIKLRQFALPGSSAPATSQSFESPNRSTFPSRTGRLRSGLERHHFNPRQYSGSTIAIPRSRHRRVAFSLTKCHLGRNWRRHMNCGTALAAKLFRPMDAELESASAPVSSNLRRILRHSRFSLPIDVRVVYADLP